MVSAVSMRLQAPMTLVVCIMRRHQKIDWSQVKIPIYDHFYIKTCFPSYYVRCNYFVTKATEVSLVTLSGASITTGDIHPRRSVLNSLLVPAWFHHQFGSTTNALSMPPAMHQQATSTCATPALVIVANQQQLHVT